MAVSVTNRRPALLALTASFLLTLLIIVGSRSLEHYDSALFGYTIASIVAFGAIVFRYAIWLQRPATRVYWRRGWNLYLQREKFWQNGYRAYIFGFALNVLQGRSILAWITFHALDFTALMVIAGCAIAVHRRLRDRGAIALQQFTLDFVPHMLLIAISVTGLMLTASSLWLKGYMYHFIALTHQATVIMTLFYLPFGKLFHVVQRPASIGVELYQERAREMPQAKCARCGSEFVAQIWLDDLKTVVDQETISNKPLNRRGSRGFRRGRRGKTFAFLCETLCVLCGLIGFMQSCVFNFQRAILQRLSLHWSANSHMPIRE